MTIFILRRFGVMLITLVIVSVITFVIIQLPPGDFLTSYITNLQMSGDTVNLEIADQLRARYGLDQPIYIQYFRWVGGLLHGDFGQSFHYQKPVGDLIWDRLGYTMLISVLSLFVIWIIAVPIGIYSAVKQYSVADYTLTGLSFVGMATPSFLLALVLMYAANRYIGHSVGGLYSAQYIGAPWSWGKLVDLLAHLWVPILVLSVGGTGGMIRTMRANLLDQLQMPYVDAARARGVSEWRLILKYPVRLAINPIMSTVGWMLPALVSGSVIVAVVLSLPTTGPLLLNSLMTQDMFLAGSLIMILSVLTMVGTLISDLLLAWVDPRIRFTRKES